MKASPFAAVLTLAAAVAVLPRPSLCDQPVSARYDAFLPGSEPPRIGYDLQAFDALFPYDEMWENGFSLEIQLGASVLRHASLGVGFGLLSLTADENRLRDGIVPLLDTDQVDLDTVSIVGSTVAFAVGPALSLQVTPLSCVAIGVEAAVEYAFFPITPNVEGEKEEEFGGQEITIPTTDETIEIDEVEYTRDYKEDIEIDNAVLARVSALLEIGKLGEMTGFVGVGKVYDIEGPEIRFRGVDVGTYGVQGLLLRIGFRSMW